MIQREYIQSSESQTRRSAEDVATPATESWRGPWFRVRRSEEQDRAGAQRRSVVDARRARVVWPLPLRPAARRQIATHRGGLDRGDVRHVVGHRARRGRELHVEGEIDTSARFAHPALARTTLLPAGGGALRATRRTPLARMLTTAAGIAMVAQDRVGVGARATGSRADHEVGAMAEAEAEHEHQCCEHDPRGLAPSWFDRLLRHLIRGGT